MAFNINDLHNIPSFGVAGNFTGHLEQAGEAKDFLGTVTEEENAPKALFPTFIPKTEDTPYKAPEFLSVYPFSSEKIIFPSEEVLHSGNLQIEPECAFLCNVEWKDEKITSLTPVAFTASNDCSIRKEGAKKISEKKKRLTMQEFFEMYNERKKSYLDDLSYNRTKKKYKYDQLRKVHCENIANEQAKKENLRKLMFNIEQNYKHQNHQK